MGCAPSKRLEAQVERLDKRLAELERLPQMSAAATQTVAEPLRTTDISFSAADDAASSPDGSEEDSSSCSYII